MCVCTQVPLEQPPGDGGELLCLEMMFLVCWMCLRELVALKNVRNASRLELFSLGAQQPSLYWLWGHPSGVSSPGPLACSAQSVPAVADRKNEASLAPSPSSIMLHLSLPGPGEAGGFLTACGPPCFS